MSSIATRRSYSEDYDDIVVGPPCEADEGRLAGYAEYLVKVTPWSTGDFDPPQTTSIPMIFSAPHHDARSGVVSFVDHRSMKCVLDNVRRAPIAYFRFASFVGLLMFVFSLVFYLVFQTILFNPLVAVFGAIGAVLTILLVEGSLLLEKWDSRNGQRATRA